MKKCLIYSGELSDRYNSNIYLKPEWYGKTGSHKDRWAKNMIKEVIKRGFDKVVTMSSGNQGLSLAYQANKHNIQCLVLTWKDIPITYFSLFKKYKSELILSDSSNERSALFNSYIRKGYFPCFLTLNKRKTKETPGIKAYKEISREIVDSIKNSPDILMIPTCYGDLSKGILEGFESLKKEKVIERIPMFILVRTRSQSGDVAFSISTNNTTRYVKEVLQKTKGKSIFLKNKDFIRARSYAKNHLGLNMEFASAGSIAGLNELDKKLIKNKSIICILTAAGR